METAAAPEPKGSRPPLPERLRVLLVPNVPTPPKLSEELGTIMRHFEVEVVTLREVMSVLKGRGYVLLMLLLSLPFATPLPLPGVSTPLGLLIALIAARLALEKHPWIPARMLDAPLSGKLYLRLFAAATRIIRAIEYFLRPRMAWLTSTRIHLQVHALAIVISSAMLLLPIPLPFSNTLPAWSVLLVSAGLLERDGLFILGGYLFLVLAAGYMFLVGLFGMEGVEMLKNWIVNRGG